eukprot:4659039-Pyramimonas_sp.AAC.1
MRHWDAAARGNSSLREAFTRVLQQEVPHHLGVTTGVALVDTQSFYGSIEWPTLAPSALALDFPPQTLYLELLQCVAARTPGLLGAATRASRPTRSVVKGLRAGTRFAKAMTHYALATTTVANPRLGQRAKIGDLSQPARGLRAAVRKDLAACVVDACEQLSAKPKSVIVILSLQDAKWVAK